MFKDLANYFDLESLDNFLTLVTSSTLDGSFVLHHLISCALRKKQPIYFCNAAQTWAHYKSVQIKLGNGTALSEAMDKQLHNFDLMDLSCHILKGDEANLDADLKQLLQKLTNKLKKESGKVLVVIDDLSVLNLLGIGENFVMEFIAGLREFRERVNLVIYSQMLEFNAHLLKDLIFMSDSHIVVDSLVTGYSKEIQGQVCLFFDYFES